MVDRGVWRCSDCGIQGWGQRGHLEHCLSLRHHYAMDERSGRDLSHYCSVCRAFCSNLPEYVNHINGRNHLDAMRREGLKSYRPGYRDEPHISGRTWSSRDRFERIRREVPSSWESHSSGASRQVTVSYTGAETLPSKRSPRSGAANQVNEFRAGTEASSSKKSSRSGATDQVNVSRSGTEGLPLKKSPRSGATDQVNASRSGTEGLPLKKSPKSGATDQANTSHSGTEASPSKKSPRSSVPSQVNVSHLRDHEYTRLTLEGHQNLYQPSSTRDGSRRDDSCKQSKSKEQESRHVDRQRQTVSDSTSDSLPKPTNGDSRNGERADSLDRQNSTIGVLAQKRQVETSNSSDGDQASSSRETAVTDSQSGNNSSAASIARNRGDDDHISSGKQKSVISNLPEYLSLEVEDTNARYSSLSGQGKKPGKEDELASSSGGGSRPTVSGANASNVALSQDKAGDKRHTERLEVTDKDDFDEVVLLERHSSHGGGANRSSGRDTKNQMGGKGAVEQKETSGTVASLGNQSTAVSDILKKGSASNLCSRLQVKKLSPLVVQKVLNQTKSGKSKDGEHKTGNAGTSPSASPNKRHKPGEQESSSTALTSVSETVSENSSTSVLPSMLYDLVEKRERLLEACKKIDKEATAIREKKQAREAAQWLDQETSRIEQWDKTQQQEQGTDKGGGESSLSNTVFTTVEEKAVANTDANAPVAPSAMAVAMSRLCTVSGSNQTSSGRPQCKYVLEDGKQCGVITFSQHCPYHQQLQQERKSQRGDKSGFPDVHNAMDVDGGEQATDQLVSSTSVAAPSLFSDESNGSLVWDDSQSRDERRSSAPQSVIEGSRYSNQQSLAGASGSTVAHSEETSSHLVKQNKKRKAQVLTNDKEPKRRCVSVSSSESQRQPFAPDSHQRAQGDKRWKPKRLKKKNRGRGQRRQISQNSWTTATTDSQKLATELSEMRRQRGKVMKDARMLQVRLDKLYQEMRSKLRRETEIVARLKQISDEEEATAMKPTLVCQSENVYLQERQHSTSTPYTTPQNSQSILSVSSGQPPSLSRSRSGCLDSDSSLASLRTGSDKPVARRVVTVESNESSNRRFTTPVARKSCSSRPSPSTDVRRNAAAKSSSESFHCESDTRVTQSPKLVSSSGGNLQSTPRLTTESSGQVVSLLKTTSESPASTNRQPTGQLPTTSVRESETPLQPSAKVGTGTTQDGNSNATLSVSTTSSKLNVALSAPMKPMGIYIKPDPDGPSETLPPMHESTGEITLGPFSGHTKVVSCVKAYSGLLFTCSTDTSCCVFDMKSHKMLRRFTDHSDAVTSVQLVPVNSKYRLFTGSRDQTVRSFDIQRPSGKACTHNFRFSSQVTALHSDWELLFVGLESGNVCCLDVKENRLAVRYDCHSPKEVICLATGNEGSQRLLLSGSSDMTIGIRHAESGLLIRTLTGHQQSVLCLAVRNNLAFSGGQDKTVHVHNYHTGKILHVIHGHKGFVTGIQFLGDSIVTASVDHHVRCYNSQNFKLLQVCSYEKESVYAMAVSAGNMLYTGGLNGSVNAIRIDLSKNVACKWTGCGLNFGDERSLLRHVTEIHRGGSSVTFQCQWSGCTSVFRGRLPESNFSEHVQSHVNQEATNAL